MLVVIFALLFVVYLLDCGSLILFVLLLLIVLLVCYCFFWCCFVSWALPNFVIGLLSSSCLDSLFAAGCLIVVDCVYFVICYDCLLFVSGCCYIGLNCRGCFV